MRRSVQIALALGFFLGLGVQVAISQPRPPSGYFSSLTVTGTDKTAVLDAGVALVNGQLQVLGPIRADTSTATVAVLDAGTVLVNGPLQVLGLTTATGSITTQSLVINSTSSHAGAASFSSYLIGNTNASLFPFGQINDGAGVVGVKMGNLNALTAGTDRYILNLYSDNLSTVAAQVTSDGTYFGGYGPVTKAVSKTAPTVTACAGGTAATMTWSNGTANFRFDVGTSCTSESTAVITLPAVANSWTCTCWNIAQPTHNIHQSGFGTTSATMTNYAATLATVTDWTDGADIQCKCQGG